MLTTSASVGAEIERPAPAGDAVPADHEIAQVTVNLTYPGGDPAQDTCVYLINIEGVDLSTANAGLLIKNAESSLCDVSGGSYVLQAYTPGDHIIFAGYDLRNAEVGPRHREQYYTGVTSITDAEIITVAAEDNLTVDFEVVYNPPAFSDVPTSHVFYVPIQYAAAHSVVRGYNDGKFKPSGTVSRQAAAAFLVRFAEWYEGEEAFVAPEGDPSFTDVPFSHPFYREIEVLAQDLLVTGGYGDGTFRPTALVTRQAVAAFLYRLEEHYEPEDAEDFETPETPTFSDVPTDHPFFREIEWMAAEGLSVGYSDGTFRPSAPVTRQAIAAFLWSYDN